ncbi:phosphoethanolamine transferase CptA [Methylophilaceae bacterium]|nr:phosphoethanolamine transferase CptA [Methylophilaceae bacterium]
MSARLFYYYLFFIIITGSSQLYLSVSHHSSFEALKDVVFICLLWILPIIIFSNHAKKIAMAMGVIFTLLALPGLFYAIIYQQELTQSLLFIIFESNIAESREYIQNYLSIKVSLIVVVYLICIYLYWTKLENFTLSANKKIIMTVSIIALVFFSPVQKMIKKHSLQAFQSSVHRHLSVASPYQLVGAYIDYLDEMKQVDANLSLFDDIQLLADLKQEQADLPSTHIVVIGESTSRLHMSLYGYERQTNPKLESMKKELKIFNNVFASRPNTIESLEQVLTFANQEHPDLYKTKPSLMAILKQAGYKLYWISNQQTLTTRNTMLTSFAKQTDEQYFLNNARSQNSYSFDEKVFDPLERVLNNNDEKKIIFVHLIGTHMSYQYRYPKNFSQFTTAEFLNPEIPKNHIERINHYDNAILYNDSVVYQLIQSLKAKQIKNSSLVYFSDHGEEVYDVGSHEFQGRNEAAPTLGMYAIPFLFWVGPDEALNRHFKDRAILIRQHDNADFIYTYLDFLGISFDGFLPHESLINQNYLEDQIMVGDPYGKNLHQLKGTASFSKTH